VARFGQEDHTEPGLLLGPDGEQVSLPAEIYSVLRQVVEVMRQGKAILVAPQGLLLTTQEAADFLGVSRPPSSSSSRTVPSPLRSQTATGGSDSKTSWPFSSVEKRNDALRSTS